MDINILRGRRLKERKLLSQSISVTVSFSVHNNLKITSVIYLFIFYYSSCCSHLTIHEHRPRANGIRNCDCARAVNNIVMQQSHFVVEQRHRTAGLCCDVTTIADKARTKIIVFYDRSTNIGYKSTSVAKPIGGV